MVEIGPIEPQHEAHREEGEAEADPGPLEGVGGRRVADRRLVRPVLGPRRVRMVRPASDRGDRGIDDEIGGLRAKRRVEALGRNPAGGQVDGVELGRELALQAADGLRDGVGQHDRRLRKVDPLQLLLHRRGGGGVGECLGGRCGGRRRRLGRRSGGPGDRERLVAGRLGARRRGERNSARLCLVSTPSRTSVEAV